MSRRPDRQAGFATPVVALWLAVVAIALGGLPIDLWRVLSAYSHLAALTDSAAVAGSGAVDIEELYLGVGDDPVLSVGAAPDRACDYLVEHLEAGDCLGSLVAIFVERHAITVETSESVSLGLARLLLIAGGADPRIEVAAAATASPFRLAAPNDP